MIVYPVESGCSASVIEEIVRLTKEHFEKGGRVITAWTPVTAQNMNRWLAMVQLWQTLDNTLRKFAGAEQMATTAGSMVIEGKLYMEAGCPEAAAQFYRPHLGVAAAKQLYGTIRRRAPDMNLPELKDRTIGTSSSARGACAIDERRRRHGARGKGCL